MRQLYKLLILTPFLLGMLIPRNSQAQPCSCPGGDPIDSVVHTVNLDSVTLFFTNVAFPKFDPAIGSLTCLSVGANVTTVSTLRIANREAFTVDYELDYSRNSILNGPGLSSIKSVNRHYGPYTLGPVGAPDTVIYVGPDTIFNNSYQVGVSTNVVPYLGSSGTINISYGNTYGYTWWQGSNNAGLDVATYSRVNMRLVYYWCPNAVLPVGIRDFSATKNNQQVNLKWFNENDLATNSYQVEMSQDGSAFKTVAVIQSKGNGFQQYSFDYQNNNGNGRVFFRVKQIGNQGKSGYSAIRSLSFGENGQINPVLYPNPVSRSVYIQFESSQTGPLQLALVNSMGQVLEQTKISASQLNSIQINFKKQYTSGIYWLRIRNQKSGEQSVSRISIR